MPKRSVPEQVNEKPKNARTSTRPGTKPRSDKPDARSNGRELQTDGGKRKVLYPFPQAKIHYAGYSEDRSDETGPLNQLQIKTLLGWYEEPETGEKFGDDFLFYDRNKKKVRLLNNLRNRPFYRNLAEGYMQEHLRRRWELNGEPIIVGKYGELLDGQHSLVGAVLAEQERLGNQKVYWADYWKSEITMERVVVYGIEGTDRVVNTMNTGKPRTITDVIFRSEYFQDLKPKDRKNVSRMLDYAIRTLWSRTWAMDNPFAPYRTHSEALDFVSRHEKLLEAVSFIYKTYAKDDNWEINSKRFGAGYAAGFLYLMGCSRSDEIDYKDADGVTSEKKLNWDYWEQARNFWAGLSDPKDAKFQQLRTSFAGLNDAQTGSGASREFKEALISRAWEVFISGTKFSEGNLKLKVSRSEDSGLYELNDFPSVGGIDKGPKSRREQVPTQEQVLKEAEAIKRQKLEAKAEDEAAKKREEHKARLLANRQKKREELAIAQKEAEEREREQRADGGLEKQEETAGKGPGSPVDEPEADDSPIAPETNGEAPEEAATPLRGARSRPRRIARKP